MSCLTNLAINLWKRSHHLSKTYRDVCDRFNSIDRDVVLRELGIESGFYQSVDESADIGSISLRQPD